MNAENSHCCETLNIILEEKRNFIRYHPSIRWYCLKDEYNPCAVDLEYCPFCGKKLPEALSEQHEEILEKEYGLTETWKGGKDYDKVPSEFHTDEWWKKRGL